MRYRTVADLLADPVRWCRRALALDAAGRKVRPRDASACRWCVEGALLAVYGDDPGLVRHRHASRRLARALAGSAWRHRIEAPSAALLNDVVGYEAVREVVLAAKI